jgi:hypothetical protein
MLRLQPEEKNMSNFPEDILLKALRKELELARLIQQSTY